VVVCAESALQTSYDGHCDSAVSFNNPSYWEVADAYLTAIIEHYKNHPALLGWTIRIGVTGESNYGPSYLENIYNPPTSWCDYSQHAKNRFRVWLTEKYSTNSALRAAWDNSTVTLATAEPPMPLGEAASQPISEAIEYANGPGDNRRMMLDWLHFRLDEKYAEWKHFVDLANQLDPNHVIAIDPASRPVQSAPETVRTGRTDSCFLHSLPGVDIVIRNPRLGPDETRGSFNTSSTSLYQSAIYARLRGKISTWAFEDTGSQITAEPGTYTVEIVDLDGNLIYGEEFTFEGAKVSILGIVPAYVYYEDAGYYLDKLTIRCRNEGDLTAYVGGVDISIDGEEWSSPIDPEDITYFGGGNFTVEAKDLFIGPFPQGTYRLALAIRTGLLGEGRVLATYTTSINTPSAPTTVTPSSTATPSPTATAAPPAGVPWEWVGIVIAIVVVMAVVVSVLRGRK
jgi:hypothetical protein